MEFTKNGTVRLGALTGTSSYGNFDPTIVILAIFADVHPDTIKEYTDAIVEGLGIRMPQKIQKKPFPGWLDDTKNGMRSFQEEQR